jgi:hypothetical protein
MDKKSFPNKSTQFSKDYQPEKNGRPLGSLSSKTILNRFLSITKQMQNPLNQTVENLTIGEILHLKQIANALEGDLSAYKEIIDRLEGKTVSVQEIKQEVTQKTLRVGYGDDDDSDTGDDNSQWIK